MTLSYIYSYFSTTRKWKKLFLLHYIKGGKKKEEKKEEKLKYRELGFNFTE